MCKAGLIWPEYSEFLADDSFRRQRQAMLLPRIEQTAPYRQEHTLITADAGYHSDANVTRQHAVEAMLHGA